MKKFLLVVLLVGLSLTMFVSCTTDYYKSRVAGMMPVRDLTAYTEGGQEIQYEIIGTIEGKAIVEYDEYGKAIENTERTYAYLENYDIASLYYPLEKVSEDAESVAFKTAIADLIVNAREAGVDFVTLPNYTINHSSHKIEISINAVGCKLLDKE